MPAGWWPCWTDSGVRNSYKRSSSDCNRSFLWCFYFDTFIYLEQNHCCWTAVAIYDSREFSAAFHSSHHAWPVYRYTVTLEISCFFCISVCQQTRAAHFLSFLTDTVSLWCLWSFVSVTHLLLYLHVLLTHCYQCLSLDVLFSPPLNVLSKWIKMDVLE